jgi:hypothetical protein
MAVDNTDKVVDAVAGMIQAGWRITGLSASGNGDGKAKWTVTWEREP